MSNTRYKQFLIFLWIVVNVAQCYELRCNFTCDVDVDMAKRYKCKERYGRIVTMEYLWDNPWRLSDTIDHLSVENGNNCSAPMKVYNEVFKNFPNIEVFHMNNSNIDKLSYESFRKGNYIRNLILPHNNIKELPSFLFGSSWNLVYLDLSYNKIERISEDAFEKYNERSYYSDDNDDRSDRKFELTFLNLQRLYLNDNLISFLEAKVFSSLKNLWVLTLNNNLIQEIDGSVLFGTNTGINLYLNSNRLTKVLNIGHNFQYLNISDNVNFDSNNEFVVNAVNADLSNINAKSLTIGERVLQISSSHNKINAFHPSNNNITEFPLMDLDLSFNSLNSMWNLTLFKILHSVNLASNLLEIFDARIFEKLSHLQYLNLSYNQFNEFDSNIFLYTNITSLDLSYNRLKHFNVNVTTDKLRKLYLAGNYLNVIDSNINHNIPNLKFLSLQDNNWSCNHLTRKILVLMMYNVRLEKAVFDIANNKRNYNSHIKGIGCFTQSGNIERQNQFKQEIENIIDQKLKEFELKMFEQINASVNNI